MSETLLNLVHPIHQAANKWQNQRFAWLTSFHLLLLCRCVVFFSSPIFVMTKINLRTEFTVRITGFWFVENIADEAVIFSVYMFLFSFCKCVAFLDRTSHVCYIIIRLL